MSQQFDYYQFNTYINNNPFIKSVQHINNDIVITFRDDFVLFVKIRFSLHNFYTAIPVLNFSYYYVGDMPHSTYEELFQEINRMSNPSTRTNMCYNSYFKSYF